MPNYIYSATDKGGKIKNGSIQAENRAGAISALLREGITPISLIPEKEKFRISRYFQRETAEISARDAANFSSDLFRLLNSGFALRQALSIIGLSAESKTVAQFAKTAEQRVAKGQQLSSCLHDQKGHIAQALAGLVRAGETGGELAAVLKLAADGFSRAAEFREKLKSALIYPAIIGFLVFVTLILFFSLVLPQLEPLFEGAEDRLPRSTQMLISIGRISEWLFPILLLSFLALFFLVKRSVRARSFFEGHRSQLMLARPFKSFTANSYFATYAQISGMLTGAGVTLDKAHETASLAIGNAKLRGELLKVQPRLRRGDRLSEVIDEVGLAPAIFLSMVRIGEQSAKLPQALSDASHILSKRTERQTDRLLAALTPLITIGLGIIVALIVGALFLGISSLTDVTEF